MKIGFTSDCHIEFFERDPTLLAARNAEIRTNLKEADIILLGGDMHVGEGALLDWIEQLFPDKPVCFITGNHEYYGDIKRELDKDFLNEIKIRGLEAQIFFLNPGVQIFEPEGAAPVRIIGATLWTDFNLFGADYQAAQMHNAAARMGDFRRIYRNAMKPIIPLTTMRWHERDKAFLAAELAKPFEGKTVVLTHHAPHPSCTWERHINGAKERTEGVTAAFASNLTDFIQRYPIDLWIYGHTHFNTDVTIAGTHLTAAQGGYPGENTSDDSALRQVGRVVKL